MVIALAYTETSVARKQKAGNRCSTTSAGEPLQRRGGSRWISQHCLARMSRLTPSAKCDGPIRRTCRPALINEPNFRLLLQIGWSAGRVAVIKLPDPAAGALKTP